MASRIIAVVVVAGLLGFGGAELVGCRCSDDVSETGAAEGPPDDPKTCALWAVQQSRDAKLLDHLDDYASVAGLLADAARVLDVLSKVSNGLGLISKLGDPKELLIEIGWTGAAAIVSSAVLEIEVVRELRRYVFDLQGYPEDLRSALAAAERDPGRDALRALASVVERGIELVAPIHMAVGGLARFAGVVASVIEDVKRRLDDCSTASGWVKPVACRAVGPVVGLLETVARDGVHAGLCRAEDRLTRDLEMLRRIKGCPLP